MAHSTERLGLDLNKYVPTVFDFTNLEYIYGLLNAPKHKVNHAVEQGVCSILLGLSK